MRPELDGAALALSNGERFAPGPQWLAQYDNANGWSGSPAYWATIQFPDLNGDNKADVCGRSAAGMHCVLSTGLTFGPAKLWLGEFTDANGWSGSPSHWATIRFADFNGDGKADVCGRSGSGLHCAVSTGTRFATGSQWTSDYSNDLGWNGSPSYWATLQMR